MVVSPLWVGVPQSVPCQLKLRPAGRLLPWASEKVYGGVPPLATMLVFPGRPTSKAGRPSVMIVRVDLFVSGLAVTDFAAAFRGVDFILVDFFAADFFVVDFFVVDFFVAVFFFVMSQGPFQPDCLRIS